jgi:hypothetical protein
MHFLLPLLMLFYIFLYLFLFFHLTGINLFFLTNIDVAVKSVDCSQSNHGMEDLQDKKADRKRHRFGAGLGGSDAFVSVSFAEKTRELNSVIEMYCSYLRRGERMAFYAFCSGHVAF